MLLVSRVHFELVNVINDTPFMCMYVCIDYLLMNSLEPIPVCIYVHTKDSFL